MSIQPPVIILTCMRSFSSLVSNMLGRHSGLYALPEMNPFVEQSLDAYVDWANLVRPRSLDGLYRAVGEVVFGGQTETNVAQAMRWIEKRASWSVVEVMKHLGAQLRPRRLIDKSPSTVLSDEALGRALETCPDAHFLHLHRHPITATRSIAKVTGFAGHGKPPPIGRNDPEFSWYTANARILQASTMIASGRFISVRGEDVLRAPRTFLPQICAWLGLETDAKDMQAMLEPEKAPFAAIGPDTAPFGSDPEFLASPDYTPRKVPEPSLDDPLDWDSPSRRLSVETLAISYQMGYGD